MLLAELFVELTTPSLISEDGPTVRGASSDELLGWLSGYTTVRQEYGVWPESFATFAAKSRIKKATYESHRAAKCQAETNSNW
jgi:hypothetical protein